MLDVTRAANDSSRFRAGVFAIRDGRSAVDKDVAHTDRNLMGMFKVGPIADGFLDLYFCQDIYFFDIYYAN